MIKAEQMIEEEIKYWQANGGKSDYCRGRIAAYEAALVVVRTCRVFEEQESGGGKKISDSGKKRIREAAAKALGEETQA